MENAQVMSISKFQNLTLRGGERSGHSGIVVLIDGHIVPESRKSGSVRRTATAITRGLSDMRTLASSGMGTMIMLTATPINNSATDLKNLIGLFHRRKQADELKHR